MSYKIVQVFVKDSRPVYSRNVLAFSSVNKLRLWT